MNEQIDQDIVLEMMLTELPQAPLPPGFVANVMARVEHEAEAKTAVVVPRFRLQFLDWALPTFIALFLGIVFVLVGQTDWLTSLLEMGETAVLSQNSLQLGLIFTVVMGEIVLGVIVCLRLWDEPLDWLNGEWLISD